MSSPLSSLSLFSLFVLSQLLLCSVHATSEWYGDERAETAPADAAGFYDIIYDESVCPNSELKSSAVPDYIYFGAMVAAFAVEDHLGCLRGCLSNSKCKSVNYYKPMTYQKSAYCELLSETQYDNPRAMRPYSNTVYFEKIHCRVDEYDLPTGAKDGKQANSKGDVWSKRVNVKSDDDKDVLKKLFIKVREFSMKRVFRYRRG